jgi:formylglycine-generating enzyme required for sulfatase activity
MGSEDGSSDEKPVRTVRIGRDYWMGRTEVTQAQYRQVTGKSPSYFKGDDLPVETVSWDDAVAFCEDLTRRERSAGRLPQGYVYRLPTEAEWEYAARGGSKSKGFTYSGGNDIDAVAWYYGNAGKARLGDPFTDFGKAKENGNCTHPVGEKAVNELGLHDMSGNVWEWCFDSYGRYPASDETDPKGPDSRLFPVGRGGSWGGRAWLCRIASRNHWLKVHPKNDDLGFRVVLAAPVQ